MKFGSKPWIAALALLLLSPSQPVHGASQLPSAPQDVFVQVNVLSVGPAAATSTFTAWVDANTPITTVSLLSETPSTTSGRSLEIPVVFDHWDGSSGTLTSSKEQRILIRNQSSYFPFESIGLQLWVGSNLTLAPPIVSSSLATYEISFTMTSVAQNQLTSAQAGVPSIVQLFASYTHVSLVDVTIHHSLSFQLFAVISTLMPLLVTALALVVVYLSIFKKPPRPSNTDYVSALVGLFLFLPIFTFSVDQIVPATQSEYVQSWLGLVGAMTAASFLVVLGSLLAVLWKRG
ncbi:MAG: hypothetical protein OK442_02880 [Thaumarchaeota archaeon]|nr:hypothetical protein [Nitrososphaerota archaeon]